MTYAVVRGFYSGRRSATATPAAIEKAGDVDGRSNTSKQGALETGAIGPDSDAISGGLSLRERLGMTHAQANALRDLPADTGNNTDGNSRNKARGGGRGQIREGVERTTPRTGRLTKPGFERLTGKRGQGRGSLAWYLLNELGANPKKVKSVVVKRPEILLGKSSAAVEQVSRWLEETLEYDRDEVLYILLKFPQAAHCSVEGNLAPKCRWLCENLETDFRGVRRILKAAPNVSFTA